MFIQAFSDRLNLAERVLPYARFGWPGDRSWPMLHLEDLSGIPFVGGISGASEYQHRARVRAGDGDIFAAVSAPTPGYEEYCRDFLGLGAPECLVAQPVGGLYQVAESCREGEAFLRLAAFARERGRLAVHPYMAHEPVWALAEDLSRAAGVPVTVIGPPPPVTWVANDKALFSELVAGVLGPEWVVWTETSDEPEALALAMERVACVHPWVGLKRTRCASAMGNQLWSSSAVRQGGTAWVTSQVQAFLQRTEWQGDEDVLVVAWEEADCSPSTQLWLPPRHLGPPMLEGIYEQVLEGETRVFLGSRPSTLGEAINGRLAEASLQVAAALQAMGYVGRCSFDFIINTHGAIRFVECNGRWGGTSTPMRLVDRLTDGRRPLYYAQDVIHPGLVGMPFPEILARLGDQLFDPRSGRGRFVLYNVGPLLERGKLDVIGFGDTPEEAMEAVRSDFLQLLGV